MLIEFPLPDEMRHDLRPLLMRHILHSDPEPGLLEGRAGDEGAMMIFNFRDGIVSRNIRLAVDAANEEAFGSRPRQLARLGLGLGFHAVGFFG